MAIIKGKAYCLPDNIDTDQIIPAKHLVYSVEGEEAKLYGKYAMSGLPEAILEEQPFIEGEAYESQYSIMVTGHNFGCGSSREHAPLALQYAGIDAIIAEDYARIFYRNAVDGGFVTPYEIGERILDSVETGDELEIDTESNTLKNITKGTTHQLKDLGSAGEIIGAGGLFEYAKTIGMIK